MVRICSYPVCLEPAGSQEITFGVQSWETAMSRTKFGSTRDGLGMGVGGVGL